MKHDNPYLRLAGMTVISFISMYILMYAMVNSFSNVFNSVNQIYMAGLMTAPMVLIELLLMGGMYENKSLKTGLMVISVVALVGFFSLIRMQTAVGDTQFLRSMIPHHAGAVLMCEKATITSPEIKALCSSIIAGQQSEIEKMKSLLNK